jgi:hypothetical protein
LPTTSGIAAALRAPVSPRELALARAVVAGGRGSHRARPVEVRRRDHAPPARGGPDEPGAGLDVAGRHHDRVPEPNTSSSASIISCVASAWLVVRSSRRANCSNGISGSGVAARSGSRDPRGMRVQRSTRCTSIPRSLNAGPMPMCEAIASRFARIASNSSPSAVVCR